MVGGGIFVARHTKKVLSQDMKTVEMGKEPPVPTLGAEFNDEKIKDTNRRLSYAHLPRRVSE
jgi:hypothetical protein